jgi:hypothetical protein
VLAEHKRHVAALPSRVVPLGPGQAFHRHQLSTSSGHCRRGYAGLSASNSFARAAMSADSSMVILIWDVLAGFLSRNDVGHVFRPFALSAVMAGSI